MYIKRFLFFLLGVEGYLKMVSRFFFLLYYWGTLKFSKKFDVHYYVRNLIKPGDTIIDIGGNLGYYSVIFAKLTGKNGKVLSVEPVTLFRKVLKRNTQKFPQVQIVPFALGETDNEKVTLGIPSGHKHFRHGLTRVQQGEKRKTDYEFVETMMRPQTLFGKLEKINYIKCDVEGYEIHIFPGLMSLIETHKPVIQVETEGENRKQITEMLSPLGYKPYYVTEKKLAPFEEKPGFHPGDIIYRIGS